MLILMFSELKKLDKDQTAVIFFFNNLFVIKVLTIYNLSGTVILTLSQ